MSQGCIVGGMPYPCSSARLSTGGRHDDDSNAQERLERGDWSEELFCKNVTFFFISRGEFIFVLLFQFM